MRRSVIDDSENPVESTFPTQQRPPLASYLPEEREYGNRSDIGLKSAKEHAKWRIG